MQGTAPCQDARCNQEAHLEEIEATRRIESRRASKGRRGRVHAALPCVSHAKVTRTAVRQQQAGMHTGKTGPGQCRCPGAGLASLAPSSPGAGVFREEQDEIGNEQGRNCRGERGGWAGQQGNTYVLFTTLSTAILLLQHHVPVRFLRILCQKRLQVNPSLVFPRPKPTAQNRSVTMSRGPKGSLTQKDGVTSSESRVGARGRIRYSEHRDVVGSNRTKRRRVVSGYDPILYYSFHHIYNNTIIILFPLHIS